MQIARSVYAWVIAALLILSASAFAGDVNLTLNYSQGSINYHEGEGCTYISYDGLPYTTEIGSPTLPQGNIHVYIPSDVVVDSVTVVSVQTVELGNRFEVCPVQPPDTTMNDDDPPDRQSVKNESVYSSSDLYPEQIIELLGQGNYGGYGIASLLVHPVQIIPAIQVKYLHTEIVFELWYSPGGEPTVPVYTRSSYSRNLYQEMIKSLVLNPEDVEDPVLDSIPPTKMGQSKLPLGNYDYLVITSSGLSPDFQPLVDWKTQKGIPATILTTQYIYTNYPGANNQEKIRNCITDAYSNWGTIWVLLGGDVEIVPNYNYTIGSAQLPGDLYYGDLTGDMYYNVFIGRASVSNNTEAATFVGKSLTYDKNPPLTDYTLKALFLAFHLDSYPTDGALTKDQKIDPLIPVRFNPITKLYQGSTKQQCIDALNLGHNLINHIDHCNWNVMGVGTGGYLSTTDMDNLTNGNKQSILYTVGCVPAAFEKNDCIAEHFVNNPNGGGVAFVGNSNSGWYSPGQNPWISLSAAFDISFFNSLFTKGIFHIGQTLADSKADHVPTAVSNSTYRWIMYELNLLGDPELPIRTDAPALFTVNHNTLQFPIFQLNNFEVEVLDNGIPMANALVCVSGCGVYKTGFTDATGKYSTIVTPNTNGHITVTVTSHNFLPYITRVKACNGHEDVVVRDCPGDDGRMPSWDGNFNDLWNGVPPDRFYWTSPDIWVDVFPFNPFDDDLNPEAGEVNHLHALISNIGSADAENCTVEFFWADAGIGLTWPTDWTSINTPKPVPKINIYSSQNIYVDWTPTASGHYCIYARVECPTDPIVSDSPEWDNNIGWKNFNVVNLKKSASSSGSYAGRAKYKIRNPSTVRFLNARLRLFRITKANGATYELVPVPAPDPDLVQIDANTYIYQNIEPGGEREVTLIANSDECDVSEIVHIVGEDADEGTPLGGVSAEIAPPDCPLIRIEKTHGTLQGHFTDVSITTEGSFHEMGGFDFLIAYDASALAFTEAEPGQLLEDCGWEYFTYRYGVEGNCGDACPSGLLRIIALAEINNGPNHPSCYGPQDCDPHEIAVMTFFVTNDRTYNGQYIPIKFFWSDCADNTISSIDGEILYIDRAIYDFEGNLIWDEEDDDLFPEDERIPFVGAPDYCLNPDPDKPPIRRCMDFVYGGIDIIPDTAIDARGDINCNGLVNEIADAVMFSNYFIEGLSAFGDHVEASIAASDVNADGIALSVADLVYLVRIITGDAPPYPKLTPYATEASVSTSVNHSAFGVSTNAPVEIGGGYFVFEYSGFDIGEPHLINGASDMTLKYSDADGILKVLVYSMEKDVRIPAGTESIFAVPISGNGTIELAETQLSDYYGNLLEVTIDKQAAMPVDYALHQNYPNPFNPSTTIFYELPVPSHVRIEVFNVLGQTVATLLDGQEEAGIHSVQWDSNDESGRKVSSGIYFYRITAAGFTAEKKMVLMK